MSGKGRGSGKTPERLVNLLKDAVSKSNQSKVASETGLTRLTLQNYLKGIGEPTTATLEKLGGYFGVSVAWLRGEDVNEDFALDVAAFVCAWNEKQGVKWDDIAIKELYAGIKRIDIDKAERDTTPEILDAIKSKASNFRFTKKDNKNK